MEIKLYTIFDHITHEYQTPFAAVNDESALRYAALAYRDNVMNRDLQLWRCGSFSTHSGVLSQLDNDLEFMIYVNDAVTRYFGGNDA